MAKVKRQVRIVSDHNEHSVVYVQRNKGGRYCAARFCAARFCKDFNLAFVKAWLADNRPELEVVDIPVNLPDGCGGQVKAPAGLTVTLTAAEPAHRRRENWGS